MNETAMIIKNSRVIGRKREISALLNNESYNTENKD